MVPWGTPFSTKLVSEIFLFSVRQVRGESQVHNLEEISFIFLNKSTELRIVWEQFYDFSQNFHLKIFRKIAFFDFNSRT
jgi:hypothetical protein